MNKMLHNLFIVKTPLQVINSIEAVHSFNLQNNILILVENKEKLYTQMKNLSDLIEWKEIIYFKTENGFKDMLNSISLLKKLNILKFNNIFFSRFGTIQRLLVANTIKNNVYYIDDGVETITIYNNILIPNTINKLNFRQLSRFRYLLFGLKIDIKDNINLFTYFNLKPLKNSKIVPNRLEYFQKKYMNKAILDKKVYILGQPLVERGFVTEELYIEYIKYIIKDSKYDVIYIPHIGEKNNSAIYKIKNKKFTITDIDLPIELYFLQKSIFPIKIISFFTTAFFTLKFLYPKSQFDSLYIEDNLILKRNKIVQEQYVYIENFGINLIKMENNEI